MQRLNEIFRVSLILSVLLFGCQSLPDASAAPQDDLPILKTDGSQHVIVQHRGLDAEWLLRIPELVGTNDAWYMIFEPKISVEWKEYGNGEIGYEWKSSPEWLQGTQQYSKIMVRPVRTGIGLAVRMRPSPNRIDLSLAVSNLTDKPLMDVWSDGGCLAAHSKHFFNKDVAYSYIKTSQGLTQSSQAECSEKLACRYVWDDADNFKPEVFWGHSAVRPTSAFVAMVATDGRGAVGLGWDHSRAIWIRDVCLHSQPFFGTLQPGQTVKRRGVILFGHTVQELFKRFEALGYRPDRTPPSK